MINAGWYYINAAHNEYLQLLVEGGVAAALLASAILILVVSKAVSHRSNPLTPFAMLGLAAIMLHSAFDYPFRVTALNCLIGFLCVLLVGGARPAAVVATRDEPKLGFVGDHPID